MDASPSLSDPPLATSGPSLWRWLAGAVGLLGCAVGGAGWWVGVAAPAYEAPALSAMTAEQKAVGEQRAVYRQLQQERNRLTVRAEAQAEVERHLRLDREAGKLWLAEDGFILRVCEAMFGTAIPSDMPGMRDWLPGQQRSWPANGAHRLYGRVGNGVFPQPDLIGRLDVEPWPDGGALPGNLVGVLVLSDGTLIYSERRPPLLSFDARPGTILLSEADMNALVGGLTEGMKVYVW